MDYVHVLDQVNGDFVYTRDSDFLKMGIRVMPAGLDRVLRDYARVTTVILTVNAIVESVGERESAPDVLGRESPKQFEQLLKEGYRIHAQAFR